MFTTNLYDTDIIISTFQMSCGRKKTCKINSMLVISKGKVEKEITYESKPNVRKAKQHSLTLKGFSHFGHKTSPCRACLNKCLFIISKSSIFGWLFTSNISLQCLQLHTQSLKVVCSVMMII